MSPGVNTTVYSVITATMDKEEKTRAIVTSGLCAGRTAQEISKFHNIKKSTVYDIKKKFEAHIAAGGPAGETSRKTHKRRRDSKGAELADILRDLVDKDPGRSMRSISKEIGVSECTVRKMMKKDLRYRSYAMRRGQFMSKATKARQLEKSKKLLWPPSSPDCNPLDYFVWGISELHVNETPHNTSAALMDKITEVMGNLNRDTVAKACRWFWSRIEAVVAADGDFIE